MKTVAIIGASSAIAKDLIISISQYRNYDLVLYVRDVVSLQVWLKSVGLDKSYPVFEYESYGKVDHEAVINFVGVGDPARAHAMGAEVLDITLRFDQLVIRELKANPSRQYIFLSSGAIYGGLFPTPAAAETLAHVPVNQVAGQDYYAAAKRYAEVGHRALSDLSIVDLRVFNYFSRTQNIKSRFFVTDMIRAVRDGKVFNTAPDNMWRDYLHSLDFYKLVDSLLRAPHINTAVDCYSRDPVDKFTLLQAMAEKFDMQYKIDERSAGVINATGIKENYYSVFHKAAEFGYQPSYSSLETVLTEASALLNVGLSQYQDVGGERYDHI